MGTIQKSVNTLEHVGFEYDWSIVSPSRTTEVMQAEHANIEINHILTRTIGQQIKLAQEGYQTRSAPFGYRNVKIVRPNGRDATIMEALEPEATWIRSIFRLRAEGQLSDEAICERINKMGYKSRIMHRRDKSTGEVVGITGEKTLTPKQLQRFVVKPIYCGVYVGKWTHGEPIPAAFEGLVSIDLFNRANHGAVVITKNNCETLSIIYGNSRKRTTRSKHKEFLLRHVIMCPECYNPFWASKSRGKTGKYWGYFHCSRTHKSVSISQNEFQETVGSYLESLEAKPGFLGLFKEVVRETWIDKNKSLEEEMKAVENHIRALETRQQNILNRITISNSVVVQTKLEKEVDDLELAIEQAKKQKPNPKLTEAQIDQFFHKAKSRLELPRKYVERADTKAKIEKTWQTIFQVPPSYDDLQSGTPQLTLLYRLNRDFEGDKRQVAADLSLHWNSFQFEVLAMLEI